LAAGSIGFVVKCATPGAWVRGSVHVPRRLRLLLLYFTAPLTQAPGWSTLQDGKNTCGDVLRALRRGALA